MTLYAIDTETNGRDPAEVIELAILRMEDLTAADDAVCITRRFKPELPSTNGALAVHHILPEELEGHEPSKMAKIPADATYILGHNIDYDWKALGSPPVKRICTLAIARALYPEVDSHKLGAMLYLLSPGEYARQTLKNAHEAQADVEICLEILGRMLLEKQLSFNSNEELWKFSEGCRIPTIMAFGKHKGLPIKDLPYDYKKWCLRQPDFDPYVLKAIRGETA